MTSRDTLFGRMCRAIEGLPMTRQAVMGGIIGGRWSAWAGRQEWVLSDGPPSYWRRADDAPAPDAVVTT